MKESHREGPASRPDPESCTGDRKAAGEALTGAHTGQPSSCEITNFGVPTLLAHAEGNTVCGDHGEPLADPAQSKTLSMCGNSLRGNREIPSTPAAGRAGRPAKVCSRTAGAHVEGKSDDCIVPAKSSNNDMRSAETMEGRRSTGGNTLQPATSWTQRQTDGSSGLQRVPKASSFQAKYPT